MAITIMQGDSYPILLELKQDGTVLTPAMVTDLEVCIGEDALRFLYSDGTIAYDTGRQLWYFWPTQEETLALEGIYDVHVRIKYPNDPAQVFGYKLDKIKIRDTLSKEVL